MRKTSVTHIITHTFEKTGSTIKLYFGITVSGRNDMADWIHSEADPGSAKLKQLVLVTFSVFYDGPVSLYCFVGPTLLFLKLLIVQF